MMLKSPVDIQSFQEKILSWWEKNRRDLPWRHTHDPYHIMVSEVMLQQTQVSRVLPRYKEFLDTFPTVKDLTKAKQSDILILWKGMGYNRRALFLKKAAVNVVEIFGGVFPSTEKELLSLPGVGLYTARAIMVFAYKQDVAMVDTNVRKIITHFFFSDQPPTEREVKEMAELLVPKSRSWEWHQALMDYGALQLIKELPKKDKTTTKSIPFVQTNRYARGRIMDAVRERSWAQSELVQMLKETYGQKEAYYTERLESLLQEGLLRRSSGDIISLPD